VTDAEAVERARLCTFDDLSRWWTKESARQRAWALDKAERGLRAIGASEREIHEHLAEVSEMLDKIRDDGFEALRRERGVTLDPPLRQ
jgi:hypothetical protein